VVGGIGIITGNLGFLRHRRRFSSEQHAAWFCREVNGLSDETSAEVLAEMDAQE
jgi:hypothetical protein